MDEIHNFSDSQPKYPGSYTEVCSKLFRTQTHIIPMLWRYVCMYKQVTAFLRTKAVALLI
jgi:hypothetical protein